jgi:hypothetical protein
LPGSFGRPRRGGGGCQAREILSSGISGAGVYKVQRAGAREQIRGNRTIRDRAIRSRMRCFSKATADLLPGPAPLGPGPRLCCEGLIRLRI